MTNKTTLIFVAIVVGLIILLKLGYGQHPKYGQRNIHQELWLLDREIQADSIKLDDGQTTDTVYLEEKYDNLNYMVFLQIRWAGATTSTYYAAPISDSSFMITKNSADTSVVQWMTIYDREGD